MRNTLVEEAAEKILAADQKKVGRVAYYVGCFEEHFDSKIVEAVIGVLEKSGFEVVVPRHKCCGLPHLAAGDRTLASELARFNFRYLSEALRKGCEAIVFSCPSCGSTLKREYPRLLGTEATVLAEKTYDVFEFLLRAYTAGKLSLDFKQFPKTIAYYVPCHVKLQQFGTPAADLMSLIPETTIKKLDKYCCGMAGDYGLKHQNFKRSLEMGGKLFKEIEDLSFDIMTTDCAGCRIQIERGTGTKAIHPIQIVYERVA